MGVVFFTPRRLARLQGSPHEVGMLRDRRPPAGAHTGSMCPVVQPPWAFGLAVTSLAWLLKAAASNLFIDVICLVPYSCHWKLGPALILDSAPFLELLHITSIRLLFVHSSAGSLLTLLFVQTDLTGNLSPRKASLVLLPKSIPAWYQESSGVTCRDHAPLLLFSRTSLAGPNTVYVTFPLCWVRGTGYFTSLLTCKNPKCLRHF